MRSYADTSRQLGHSSSDVTREHYVAKPAVAADHAELLQAFAEPDADETDDSAT